MELVKRFELALGPLEIAQWPPIRESLSSDGLAFQRLLPSQPQQQPQQPAQTRPLKIALHFYCCHGNPANLDPFLLYHFFLLHWVLFALRAWHSFPDISSLRLQLCLQFHHLFQIFQRLLDLDRRQLTLDTARGRQLSSELAQWPSRGWLLSAILGHHSPWCCLRSQEPAWIAAEREQ